MRLRYSAEQSSVAVTSCSKHAGAGSAHDSVWRQRTCVTAASDCDNARPGSHEHPVLPVVDMLHMHMNDTCNCAVPFGAAVV